MNTNMNNTLKALHDGNTHRALQHLGLHPPEKQLSPAKTHKSFKKHWMITLKSLNQGHL